MAKTLFDHLKAIYEDQSLSYFDTLVEADKKSYSAYMINRLVSMNPACIELVNDFQMYLNSIGSRESYLFYSQVLPRGKQFNKYIKAAKAETYDDWLVALIARHYQVSRRIAVTYLNVYFSSDEQKEDLRAVLELYGTDPKKIKKVLS